MKFYARLKAVLKDFDLKTAEALSLEMHDAECNGYPVIPLEDRLWFKLTEKILKNYHD